MTNTSGLVDSMKPMMMTNSEITFSPPYDDTNIITTDMILTDVDGVEIKLSVVNISKYIKSFVHILLALHVQRTDWVNLWIVLCKPQICSHLYCLL